MKIILLSLMATVTFSLASFAAEGTVKNVKVNGMVCSFCAQGIEKKFKSEEAVKSIDVSLENRQVVLTFKEGRELSNDRTTQLLKEAGYSVETIE